MHLKHCLSVGYVGGKSILLFSPDCCQPNLKSSVLLYGISFLYKFFFYITLHVLLHQYHLAGCWFHPILISQDYFYTTYINYFKMHSDLDLVN